MPPPPGGADDPDMARILGSLLILLAATAQAARYQASLEASAWQTAATPVACSLTHPVPYYGRAVFYRLAGEPLGFRLEAEQAPAAAGALRVSAVPPPWRHEARPRLLGEMRYSARAVPLDVAGEPARWLLEALEEGMTPRFEYTDAGRPEVIVSVVNFRAALVAFRACQARLLPVSFRSVARSEIHFPTNHADLSDADRTRLRRIADYVLADDSVRYVRVEGHADDVGTRQYNDALSELRAVVVAEFLAECGVPPERLRPTYFGETRPAVRGRDPESRARNRRVVVELVRGAPAGAHLARSGPPVTPELR